LKQTYILLFTKMKFFLVTILAAVAALVSAAGERELSGKIRAIDMYVTNIAYQQPFSGFFIMVHDDEVPPLYKLGQNASAALANLAENGDPSDLVAMYEGMDGVLSAVGVPLGAGGPLFGGETGHYTVEFTRRYRYLTVATMAVNTNDCFIALNGKRIVEDAVYMLPGLDAGSEENNEECSSIPGPACPMNTGNEASGNGEGFVHVHRGFHGLTQGQNNGLSAQGYDWRNPMMKVVLGSQRRA